MKKVLFRLEIIDKDEKTRPGDFMSDDDGHTFKPINSYDYIGVTKRGIEHQNVNKTFWRAVDSGVEVGGGLQETV